MTSSLWAQEVNDSLYSTLRLVPRFAANIQKGCGLETGLFLNNFKTEIVEQNDFYMLSYTSSGFYLSNEFSFSDFDHFIIGPKIGWELSTVAPTFGSFLGSEFIYYTDFNKSSPCIMLKLGIPFNQMNVGYGYAFYFNDNLKNKIGKHRLTISYSLNRKAKREYNKLYDKIY
jgi:hypothetical protein